jgi:hypothetical protein
LPILSATDGPRVGLHLLFGHHKQLSLLQKQQANPTLSFQTLACLPYQPDINFESCPHTSIQLILKTSIFKNAADSCSATLAERIKFLREKKNGVQESQSKYFRISTIVLKYG